jgi:hypothetical protein
LSRVAVEVNTVNIGERFHFGGLGVKGSRSFYLSFGLGRAAVAVMFCYAAYHSLGRNVFAARGRMLLS